MEQLDRFWSYLSMCSVCTDSLIKQLINAFNFDVNGASDMSAALRQT